MRSTVTLLLVLTLAGTASAQTYNRNQTYENPNSTTTAGWRNSGCSDPWVGIAVWIVFGRVDKSRCGPQLYNGGQWNSFNQLVHAVAQTDATFREQGASTRIGKDRNGRPVVVLIKSNQIVAVLTGNLIGHDGATLVGQDGASLIGDGGGTIAQYVAPGHYVQASKMTVRLPVGMIAY